MKRYCFQKLYLKGDMSLHVPLANWNRINIRSNMIFCWQHHSCCGELEPSQSKIHHRLRPIRQAQSADKVARAQPKFAAPRHSMPQCERSDTHKVRRLLREPYRNSHPTVTALGHAQSTHEPYQNWHRATTTSIGHAQSAERVEGCISALKSAPRHSQSDLSSERSERAHIRFSQNIARTTKKEEHFSTKNDVLPWASGIGHFSSRSTKYRARPRKWARGQGIGSTYCARHAQASSRTFN